MGAGADMSCSHVVHVLYARGCVRICRCTREEEEEEGQDL